MITICCEGILVINFKEYNITVELRNNIRAKCIRKCNFQELEHQPNGPDISPSDYYLHLILKKHIMATSPNGRC